MSFEALSVAPMLLTLLVSMLAVIVSVTRTPASVGVYDAIDWVAMNEELDVDGAWCDLIEAEHAFITHCDKVCAKYAAVAEADAVDVEWSCTILDAHYTLDTIERAMMRGYRRALWESDLSDAMLLSA